MSAFEYLALDAKGREKKGTIEGDTQRSVRNNLRSQSLTPIRVTPVVNAGRSSGNASITRRSKLSNMERALFTRQLATLLRANLPVEEALNAVAEQTEKAKVVRVIVGVRSQVMEGSTLADALHSFPDSFGEMYVATVAAGEKSGHMGDILEGLSEHIETQQDIRQKILGALLYPAFLTVVATIIVIVLMTTVVPDLVGIFNSMNAELPALTRGLIAISHFVGNWGVVLLIIAAGLVVGVSVGLRQPEIKAKAQALVLRTPLFGGFARCANAARFTRTLALLSGSGVPVLDAMAVAGAVITSIPIRTTVEKAITRVREGESIHAALSDGNHFPAITLHMIANGETAGDLEGMLIQAARQQERELDTLRQGIVSILGPVIILLMGGVVLLIVLAVLLPTFNMNALIQ